jgi:hypothetical protein
VWGVQFHPELSPQLYGEWAANFGRADPALRALLRKGTDDFQRYDADVEAATRAMAKRFAEIVLAAS